MRRREFIATLSGLLLPSIALALDGYDENGVPVAAEPVKEVDSRPEMWAFYTVNCLPCNRAKRELAEAETPFQVLEQEQIPTWLKLTVVTFPTFYWPIDSDVVIGSKHAMAMRGFTSVKSLTSEWQRTRMPVLGEPRPLPVIKFGNPWFEYDNWGRRLNTSTSHLTNVHHVPQWVIDRYANDQNAINRIHGRMHENGNLF